jgi:tetratricopeptide (TPR) repeat protein
MARDTALRHAAVEGRIRQALDDTQAAYDADKLPDALAATRRAEVLLASDNGVGNGVREELARWQSELVILQLLENPDPYWDDRASRQRTDAAYARIFLDIDIDIDGLPAEEAGRRIRSHLVWRRLTEALDAWAIVRHVIESYREAPEAERRRQQVFQVARAADADELRSQARLAVQNRDLPAAERLAALPEVNRLPADALRNLAHLIYYGGGEQAHRERAIGLLERALVERPGDFRLNYACGFWYENLQTPRLAEAGHYYSIVVALRPESPLARLHRGIVYGKLHQYDKALTDFDKALEQDPKFVAAWINRGVTYSLWNKDDKALADFNIALELDPSIPHTWNSRGVA